MKKALCVLLCCCLLCVSAPCALAADATFTLMTYLCGTDLDPQNVAEQERRLREYGVLIQPSNAKAALLAGLIVS